MINSKHRKAIITNWILSSHEYKNIQLLKSELVKLIETSAFKILTKDEKKYIEIFGINATRKQRNIDWCIFNELSNKGELNLPQLSYGDYIEKSFYNRETRSYFDTYDERLVKGVGRYEITLKIKKGIPVLFNSLEEFLKIKKRDKLLYDTLLCNIRSYLTEIQSLKIKFNQLCEVLCSSNIGLSDLKEYYVELYNLRK